MIRPEVVANLLQRTEGGIGRDPPIAHCQQREPLGCQVEKASVLIEREAQEVAGHASRERDRQLGGHFDDLALLGVVEQLASDVGEVRLQTPHFAWGE